MIVQLFLIVGVLLLVFSWIRLMKDRSGINIHGPVPIPVLGNGHLFGAASPPEHLKFLGVMSEQYNAACLLYIMSQRLIVLSKPQFMEPLLTSSEFISKSEPYTYMEPWLGKGLLTASGQKWRSHRKFLTPAFHFNIQQSFMPVFCKNTRILVQKLSKMADGQTHVDLFPLIALAALDNITESIMGVCVDAQKDGESEYVKAIDELASLIFSRMRNPLLGVDFIFNMLPHKGRQERALKILHGQTDKVIEARRAELEKLNITQLKLDSEHGIKNRHAFLDLLLLAEVDGKRIDDVEVREEVDTFMFEGHDTSTCAIVYTMFCISKLDEAQKERLLEEQRQIFADDDFDREPTSTELNQMKYLEMVINESMRLYPPVPLIQRYITRDTEVCGMRIPRDTSVVFDLFHMHRRADVFAEPLHFRPERFGPDSGELKNAFSWLPFSAGPRNCIGRKFAMMELKVTLSYIIRKFELLPTGREPVLRADIVLRPTDGVFVKLLPRK